MKNSLKNKAIRLRKKGLSYTEILKQILVAKSTLSLWLRSVNLTKKQKQKLTAKKLEAAQRGANKQHLKKIKLIVDLTNEAEKEITRLTKKDLWLIGVALYWAEGSKEKEHTLGQQVIFSNSDYKMIKIFLKWLKEIIKIKNSEIAFEIYIHKTANSENALNWWSRALSCEKDQFKLYFKKHNIKKTNRRNTNNNYHGLLRVRVKKSSRLNKKISAWINTICKYIGG